MEEARLLIHREVLLQEPSPRHNQRHVQAIVNPDPVASQLFHNNARHVRERTINMLEANATFMTVSELNNSR